MPILPIGVNTNNIIDDLRGLSWETADILKSYSSMIKDKDKKNNIIKNKKNEDPVTLADLEVNELILRRIRDKYPNIKWDFLSEENAKLEENYQNRSDWKWVLDPLDGTKDFLQETQNYAMHFALNYKNRPYLGVVLIPERDELWIADGKRAWCEGSDGNIKRFDLTRKCLIEDMTLVTSKNHSNQILQRLIEVSPFKKIIVMGSIGCKIASILRGESDIYISFSLPNKSSPKDWDFAAPEVVLNAAGGCITNLENVKLEYNKFKFEHKGFVIASNNKEAHEKICLQLKEIIKINNIDYL